MHAVLLTYYSVAIVAASIGGGLLLRVIRLDHRRTELVVSFVAGVMLGIALLHMLPHAVTASRTAATPLSLTTLLRWSLGGFLAMFFIERFFCFHHHDLEATDDRSAGLGCRHAPDHRGDFHGTEQPPSEHTPGASWGGAAVGLTLHSLLAGVALAASVRHADDATWLPGFGAFAAIVLHKPLDAMAIAVLMRRAGWSLAAQATTNALFALAVPLGVILFNAGVPPVEEATAPWGVAAGLAFSVGVFLCVSMSDLLPELQFHDHDRVKLSIALVAGLAIADVAARLETHEHENVPTASQTASSPEPG